MVVYKLCSCHPAGYPIKSFSSSHACALLRVLVRTVSAIMGFFVNGLSLTVDKRRLVMAVLSVDEANRAGADTLAEPGVRAGGSHLQRENRTVLPDW